MSHKIPPALLVFLATLLSGLTSFSQKKTLSGIVKDRHSDETIPFASVYFVNSTVGTLTDSAGGFHFVLSDWPSDTLEISTVGYQTFKYVVDRRKDSILLEVMMERGTFNEGVRVRVKVNKGLLLWKKIVDHKPFNDKFRFENFSYNLYNKLEVDLKNINFSKFGRFKPLRPIAELINSNIDTSETLPYLPAYLTEVLSNYYYQKKPLKRREVIVASNTNGVRNESAVKLLGGMDQNVNVYNNFIPVADKEFISPLSENGDNFYNYRVIDTQFVNKQRFYHLVFAPKRRGENTFEGDCWVHDSTFAIQKMSLRLSPDANINFVENLSMIQEYHMINDSTWFLWKDKFVLDMSPMGKESLGFIGRKTTTYRNIVVNDTSVVKELDKNKIMEEVIVLDDALHKSKEFWSESRHEELTKNEAAIIKMIDTLTNSKVFQRFTNTLNFIATGYLNVGNFQLGPWYYWFTANSWEGFRMRFDLGTNWRFNKKLWLHGYLAYGFGDKRFKGKAEVFFLPKKHPRLFLYASYTNDLDFGQNYYGEVTSDNIFALAIRKNNVPVKYMNIEESRFEFFTQSRSGFSALFATTHKNFTPLKNIPPKDSFPVEKGNPMTTFEFSVRFRFAYLEKFLENYFFRASLGSPYPIPELYLSKGISGVFNSAYNYFKISGSLYDFMKVPPIGTMEYFVFAGRTFGTLPYVLLNIAPGNELYYYNKYAFNMMNRYEFIHDRYAGFSFEHNIGSGLFRVVPRLKFRQFYNVRALWGGLSDENRALNLKDGSGFQTLDNRTYMEIGTGIDNILRILRIDLVWRIMPAPLPRQNFGIFGSFRLTF